MINYHEFTMNYLEDALNNIFKESKNPSSAIYTTICSNRLFKLLNITNEEKSSLISSKEANLKRRAIMIDAYLCPTWDCLKYPEIDLYKNKYSNSFTNEQFESVGEDEYGDDILIYTNRIYNYD